MEPTFNEFYEWRTEAEGLFNRRYVGEYHPSIEIKLREFFAKGYMAAKAEEARNRESSH